MGKTNSGIVYEKPVITWQSEPRFIIPSVNYRGQEGTYLLFEKMLPTMTQDKIAEVYETEKQSGNPRPTDMPLMLAIATRGYELRGESSEDAEKLRNFLRQGMRQFPNTLTRLHYSPVNDAVVHNVGTSDQYHIETELTGEDNWISNLHDSNALEAILGTQDKSKVGEVSQWINGTNAYLLRINSKPKNGINKRVARFDAYGGRLIFDCNWNLRGEDPSFRVLQVE